MTNQNKYLVNSSVYECEEKAVFAAKMNICPNMISAGLENQVLHHRINEYTISVFFADKVAYVHNTIPRKAAA